MTDTKIDDGGFAFPRQPLHPDFWHEGMTLRDWFAGLAMKGLLAAGGWAGDEGEGLLSTRSRRAADSVAEADALIAALRARLT